MAVIETETFISEIDRRPQLYNINLKEYSDSNVKENLWGELWLMFILNSISSSRRKKEDKCNAIDLLHDKYEGYQNVTRICCHEWNFLHLGVHSTTVSFRVLNLAQ